MTNQSKKSTTWAWEALVLFIMCMLFSFALQFSFDDLIGVDGYYHIAMADLMRHEGVTLFGNSFPYLQFTTLNDHFANQHFLYHVLLLAFTFFDLLLGAKIAAGFFAGCAFFSIYVLLRVLTGRYAKCFMLFVPFLSSGFLFRMFLPRAPAVSLAFMLVLIALQLWYTTKKQSWKVLIVLGIGSFLFVWLYGGFVLMGVWCVLYTSVSLLLAILFKSYQSLIQTLKSSAVVFLGFTLGIVLHPFFPEILLFLKTQVFKTGSMADIPVGGEWSSYDLDGFVANTAVVLILFVISLILLAINVVTAIVAWRIKMKQEITQSKSIYWYSISQNIRNVVVTIGLFSCALGVATIISKRYVEYFVPFAFVFFCIQAARYFPAIKKGMKRIFSKLPKKIMLVIACVPILIIIECAVAWHKELPVYVFYVSAKETVEKRPYSDMREITDFTKTHVPPGEIIFNVSWDDFPALFLGDRTHYYVWGLDPLFLYEYDSNLYEKAKQVWEVQDPDALKSIIVGDFNSHYVYVHRRDEKLIETLDGRRDFTRLIGNEAGVLFEVKDYND